MMAYEVKHDQTGKSVMIHKVNTMTIMDAVNKLGLVDRFIYTDDRGAIHIAPCMHTDAGQSYGLYVREADGIWYYGSITVKPAQKAEGGR